MMENEHTLSQTNSLGGTGTQIANQNNYYGMSYSETKNLCLDLIKVELDNYKETAAYEAKIRNEELLNSFIKKMQEEKIDKDIVGEVFKNPDMQYTYIDAQKAYIRSGTKDLEEILTELLVCRIKEKEHSLLQIALKEAINVVPMLLPKHFDALALCFLLKYSKDTSINSMEGLVQYLNTKILPHANFLKEANKESFFTHLSYIKAGNVEVTSNSFEGILAESYAGLFCSGYENMQIEKYKIKYPKLFMPCLHDSIKWQINAMDEETLKQMLENYPNMLAQEKEDIIQLFKKNIMSEDKVKDIICKMNPNYMQLFEIWNKTSLQSLTLTSVGIVLGIMHIKRVTGGNIDMNIWI